MTVTDKVGMFGKLVLVIFSAFGFTKNKKEEMRVMKQAFFDSL